MLELRRVTPLDITQRRIALHDPTLDQIIQAQQVLLLPQPIQIPATKGNRAEILLDHAEQAAGGGDAERDVGRVGAERVVADLGGIVEDVAAAADGAEGLDGEDLVLLHLGGLVAAFDDGDGLAAVDRVWDDVVPVEVADRFDRVGLPVERDFVGFHGFLDRGADIAEADVDAGFANAGVGGFFDGGEELVVLVVEGHGEGGVDDATVHVHAEVDFHHVLVREDLLVAGVRGEVRGAVVQAETGGEAGACDDVVAFFEAHVARQVAGAGFDAFGDLGEGHARFDMGLGPFADLTVNFRALAVVGEEVGVHAVQVSLLLVCGAIGVVVLVFDLFAGRVVAVGVQI